RRRRQDEAASVSVRFGIVVRVAAAALATGLESCAPHPSAATVAAAPPPTRAEEIATIFRHLPSGCPRGASFMDIDAARRIVAPKSRAAHRDVDLRGLRSASVFEWMAALRARLGGRRVDGDFLVWCAARAFPDAEVLVHGASMDAQ